MRSVFSRKSPRLPALVGIVFMVLAFAAVSWSDTERNVDAGQGTVIAMRASGAANPCAADNPCNPCNPCVAANPCNPCNPCAAANPCNPCNPCAAVNPCNPCNPCGAGGKIDPKQVLRPPGTGLHAGLSQLQLLTMGEALWNDRSLSTNGLACGVCHQNGANFADTFAEPYPHRVEMPHRLAGVDKVALDEMIQFCMLQPMAAEALPWGSPELAALTAYGAELQRAFAQMAMTNPCNPCNPCAAANPCNPCNPCAAANACNPCAAANPCNPCAAGGN